MMCKLLFDRTLQSIWGSVPRPGLGRMLPLGITGAFLALAVVFLAASAGAQDAAPIDAPLLDRTHTRSAHRIVEGWVRAGQVPDKPEQTLRVSGAIGVHITLRDAGLAVGDGAVFRPDTDASVDRVASTIDLVPLLAVATRQGLAAYDETLRDAALSAVNAGRADAKPEPSFADLTVQLEIAHRLESIQLPRIAPLNELYARFAPGFHGLRVLSANGKAAAVTWPSTALTRNTQPKSQIVQPLDQLGYPIDAIAQVGRADGPALQRFHTIHIVRPTPNRPAVELVRGNAEGRGGGPFPIQLQTTTDRLASHLSLRLISQRRVRGTYQPSTNRYDPPLASPVESALAAYALARYASGAAALGNDDDQTQAMARSAGEVAMRVGEQTLGRAESAPAQAALALLTLCELPVGGDQQVMRDRLAAWLIERQQDDGLFARIGKDQAPRALNLPTNALIASAVTTVHQQTRKANQRDAAVRAIDGVWVRIKQEQDTAALPWLMLALDRVPGDDHDTQRAALGEVMDKLNRQQVVERPLLGPDDVNGGYELFPGTMGSPPMPDWRTSQPLMFLAIALRSAEARGERNTFGWVVSAQNAARFLQRLTYDPNNAYYVAGTDDALSGVRKSFWDNELAISPNALTLLALTELRLSIAQLEREQAEREEGQAAKVPVDEL